jgi:adenine-specific DNA-methyltransferase
MDSITRLNKVIEGENNGISKAVNWKGGGSFLYCELMGHNESIINSINKAKTSKELLLLWREMQKKASISYKIDPKQIDENISEFEKLSLEGQKRLLIETLDKNQLYVNYSEIEDKDYDVSESDKKLNRKFYGDA